MVLRCSENVEAADGGSSEPILVCQWRADNANILTKLSYLLAIYDSDCNSPLHYRSEGLRQIDSSVSSAQETLILVVTDSVIYSASCPSLFFQSSQSQIISSKSTCSVLPSPIPYQLQNTPNQIQTFRYSRPNAELNPDPSINHEHCFLRLTRSSPKLGQITEGIAQALLQQPNVLTAGAGDARYSRMACISGTITWL